MPPYHTCRGPHSPSVHDGSEQSWPTQPSGQRQLSGPSQVPPFSHTKEHTADTARMAWFPASATYRNTYRYIKAVHRGGGERRGVASVYEQRVNNGCVIRVVPPYFFLSCIIRTEKEVYVHTMLPQHISLGFLPSFFECLQVISVEAHQPLLAIVEDGIRNTVVTRGPAGASI